MNSSPSEMQNVRTEMEYNHNHGLIIAALMNTLTILHFLLFATKEQIRHSK